MANGNGNGAWQKIAIGLFSILTTIIFAWTGTISGQVTENTNELGKRGITIEQSGQASKENAKNIKELNNKVDDIDKKVDRIQILQELDLKSRGIPLPSE